MTEESLGVVSYPGLGAKQDVDHLPQIVTTLGILDCNTP